MKKHMDMILLAALIFLSFSAVPREKDLNTAANVSYLSDLEKEIIYEINLFRSNPGKYASNHIAPLAKHYNNKLLRYPGEKVAFRTNEGASAVIECVNELKKAKPLRLLHPDHNLTKAANDHQKDQEKTGRTGHRGSDGSDLRQRIERYGYWEKRIAENIAYGNSTARQIVVFLLIDDGVKDRGHRKNLLHPEFGKAGISFGKHPVYQHMCVIDFAGGMRSK